MRLVEGQHLRCQDGAVEIPPVLEDVEFRRCSLEMCQHWRPRQEGPEDRPVIRRMTLVRCRIKASELPPVIAEDCVIDTVSFHRGTWGPQLLKGWAFRHVSVRGNITGSVALTPGPATLGFRASSDATGDPYVVANRRFYEDVDWALDISEARFTSIEMGSGIPSALIRRDPETQVVLRRSTLLARPWRNEVSAPLARIWIENLLASGFDDRVIVAGKRGRGVANELEIIHSLREAGLAE